MTDGFSYLNKHQVSAEGTAEYTLDVEMPNGEFPVFIGRHAGAKNARFVAAMSKIPQRKRRLSVQELEDRDFQEREIFAKCVITGWRNVVNDKGKPSPFSTENCDAFLKALPFHLFNDLATFFINPENFTNESLSQEEAEELGNGSEEG